MQVAGLRVVEGVCTAGSWGVVACRGVCQVAEREGICGIEEGWGKSPRLVGIGGSRGGVLIAERLMCEGMAPRNTCQLYYRSFLKSL